MTRYVKLLITDLRKFHDCFRNLACGLDCFMDAIAPPSDLDSGTGIRSSPSDGHSSSDHDGLDLNRLDRLSSLADSSVANGSNAEQCTPLLDSTIINGIREECSAGGRYTTLGILSALEVISQLPISKLAEASGTNFTNACSRRRRHRKYTCQDNATQTTAETSGPDTQLQQPSPIQLGAFSSPNVHSPQSMQESDGISSNLQEIGEEVPLKRELNAASNTAGEVKLSQILPGGEAVVEV